jgi:hypothetical protein
MEIQINDISKKPNSFENNKLINPDFEIDTDDNEEYDEEQLDEVGDEIDDETLEIINRIRFKNINNEQNSILKKIDIPNKKETINKKPKKNNKNMSLQEFIFKDGMGNEHCLNFSEKNNLLTQTSIFEEVRNYLETKGE